MRNFFLFTLLIVFATGNAQSVKEHGQLQVTGTQLTDAYNKPVMLRGMSFGWHNWWPRFYNKEAVAWLAKDWGCNVVRAAMGIEPDGGYIKDAKGSTQKIEAVIDGAIASGIYVIIDWHSHNINTKEAKEFFSAMAKKYGKHPNIIYEIFNEPDEESWDDVKAYSQEVIAAIRAIDPDNIILVGNPHWDQDLHVVADAPLLNQTNIMYTLHFYAATHKEFLRKRADYALSKGIPIFISESAGMEAAGDGALNQEEWKRWIEWAEAKGISWVTWSISDKDETCSVLNKSASSTGGWKDTDLKESGIKSKQLLKSYNAQTSLSAKDLLPYGRTAITDNKLELISSAAHFSFSFEGTECLIFSSMASWQNHNYLQYEIDGVYQKRLKISKENPSPIILCAKNNGRHTVKIFKATEAHSGPIFIEKITGNKLKSIAPSPAPLIEFIGNSITCGAAADASEVPCGTGEYLDQHSAYYAYGPGVARALKVNYVLSSVSGIGIYRNWNSDGPTMPQVYRKTDFQEKSERQWNFKTYAPKIVSIALGTNDFSNGDGKKQRLPFDSPGFVTTYIKFVQQVKTIYPAAQIALLSSAMINGSNRTLLQNCLTAVKKSVDGLYPAHKPVALYFFKPMKARGCSGHPSVKDHALLAKELTPFFNNLLRRN